MSGQTFQPGERVRFSGEGVVQDFAINEHTVTIRMRNGRDMYAPRDSVTIERVAPAGWPGNPGDRWQATCPAQIWMTGVQADDDGTTDSYTLMVCTDGRRMPADDVLLMHGPIVAYGPVDITINEWRTGHGYPAVPGGDGGAVSTSGERLDRTLPGWDDTSVMPQISHVTGELPLLIDPPAVRDPALDETQIFPRIEDERPW